MFVFDEKGILNINTWNKQIIANLNKIFFSHNSNG